MHPNLTVQKHVLSHNHIAYPACQDKCSCMQTAAENDLASELHWRIAALEALHAFVVGPCSQASPSQAATLISASAALLQPTLDAICASPALQVNAHAAFMCCM